MNNNMKFYIDGKWVAPATPSEIAVINPATEEQYTAISGGSASDVDKAVSAARRAFGTFSTTTKAQRLALLRGVLKAYNERFDDLAHEISREMGAPLPFATDAQAWSGRAHLEATIEALENYRFTEKRGSTTVVREPVGVCALITPWNWPVNQIVCKVAPALAAGCTVVLKPSEIAPISGIIFAEIMDAAGVPPGVFNLVNGFGDPVGSALSSHSDVDMVSFTGSTRAGILVAKSAADTVKRVAQELGGKSANIILPDADFEVAVAKGVTACFSNSGQSCDAPTRMLVPAERHCEAVGIARKTAEGLKTGDPLAEGVDLGPVVSQVQFDKIQGLIRQGIADGATLVAGGEGRPDGMNRGYYIKPTVFAGVTPDMAIAKEEIFGPVLSIMPYVTIKEAVRIANDTEYGLAAYIQSTDIGKARDVASQMRAGSVYINYPEWDVRAPFGGYKQSGNGREYADWAIHDFLEIKGVVGWGD